jgi:hypothetical protein
MSMSDQAPVCCTAAGRGLHGEHEERRGETSGRFALRAVASCRYAGERRRERAARRGLALSWNFPLRESGRHNFGPLVFSKR